MKKVNSEIDSYSSFCTSSKERADINDEAAYETESKPALAHFAFWSALLSLLKYCLTLLLNLFVLNITKMFGDCNDSKTDARYISVV